MYSGSREYFCTRIVKIFYVCVLGKGFSYFIRIVMNNETRMA